MAAASSEAERLSMIAAATRYRGRHPKKVAAKRKIESLIKSGALRRSPCELCGARQAFAHHDDYDKPLDVRWLCRSHHQEWHLENGEGANAGGDGMLTKRAKVTGENTSQFPGVSWSREKGRWVTRAMWRGKRRYRTFTSEVEAFEFYKAAVVELRGVAAPKALLSDEAFQ